MNATYDFGGHQEYASAVLLWEFMPIEHREEFLIMAELPSTQRPKYLRLGWAYIPFDVRMKLLGVFYIWNARLRQEREENHDGPAVKSPPVCLCGKKLS